MQRETTKLWPSACQFAFSALAVFTIWGSAASMAVYAAAEHWNGTEGSQQGLSLLLMASGLAATGLLLLPSAVYALLRLLDKRPPRLPYLGHPALWIAFLPFLEGLVLVCGAVAANTSWLQWLLLPALHILAIGIPVLWFVLIAMRGLYHGSPQRAWGIFASGAVLGPFLIMILEVAALLVFSFLLAAALASQPGASAHIRNLLMQISHLRSSPDEVIRLLIPYATKPPIVVAVLVFGAVIVPLIEELLKPAGVWLLAGRDLTPADGFVAGVLSGAGYAFFENLALSNGGGEVWSTLVSARIGTAVIHILTTGITGWAIVQAWQNRRYLLFGASYLAAVTIHGLWNFLALSAAFAALKETSTYTVLGEPVSLAASLAGLSLLALTMAGLAALLWINWRLRNAPAAPAS